MRQLLEFHVLEQSFAQRECRECLLLPKQTDSLRPLLDIEAKLRARTHKFDMSASPESHRNTALPRNDAKCQKPTSAGILFDHLVCASYHRWWHYKTESFRRFQIDQELEFRWLLNWKIGGFCPLQNFVDID